MKRDVLVFSLTLLVLIGVGACIQPITVSDDPDPQSDPVVVVSVSASDHDGNVPENTLDGDLSTRWSAQGEGQYITFGFNESVLLDSIGIAWYLGDERYSTYKILTSIDGATWVSRVSRATDELTLDHQTDRFDADARFVRIVGYGNSQSSWNSITSVRFNDVAATYAPVDPAGDPDRATSFRGDPNFDPVQLTNEQRAFYERFIEEMNDPGNAESIQAMIDRDNLFYYARTVHGHIQAVLIVFRMTGDLALLDHVIEVTDAMREHLDYGWRDTSDGSDGMWDEYLMWVYRGDDRGSNEGKDNKIDDIKANALIAMVTYALDENRDLESPNGYDYGARADFWTDYLVNHYEAKWRDRSNKPTGHPITTPHSDSHSWWSWIKGSYYMAGLTGDAGWLAEANRAADIVWEHEIRDVADYGEPYSAYVWMSNIRWQSSSRNYLQSTAYSGSNYGDAVLFHLEGFHNWADEEHMRSFARSITEYQFTRDDGSKYVSPTDVFSYRISEDIGGNVERAGIPPNHEVPRRTAEAFLNYQTPLMSAWDPSGELAAVSETIQNEYPDQDSTRIAAGLFVRSYLAE